MKFCFLMLLIFCAFTIQAQVYNNSDFVESPTPKSSKEIAGLYQANLFSVQIINGNLQITDRAPHPSMLSYKTAHGTFWAENKGEWGGGVYYKPNDTTIKVIYLNRKPVSTMKDYTYLHDTSGIAPLNFSISGLFLINPHNSNALFNFKDRLYFMNNEGDNPRNKSGSINQIVQHRDNTINILPIANFETSPDLRNIPVAMVTKGNRIYVVTDKGFYIIKHHKNQEILKDMFWESLAPRSIAVIGSKEIFVGIRGGYVKINSVNKKYTFYKYNK